jgi:alcohol dehydrogenase class IV
MADLRVVARPIPEALMQVNCVERLGNVLKGLKAQRAFLITDDGLVKAGVAAKVTGVLDKAGIPSTLFAGIMPNPTVEVVNEGARTLHELMVRRQHCCASEALGGHVRACSVEAVCGCDRGPV